MFGYDPIDLFDPTPYDGLSYYAHLALGLLGLLAAMLAFLARKGSRIHIRSGQVFMGAIVVVALTSASMLSVNFVPPLFLAMVSVLYAIGSGWLALQPRTRRVAIGEFTLFAVETAALITFLYFGIHAALAGTVPLFGPLSLTAIPLILLAGDVHWFAKSGQRKALRLRRHLARMIWATIIAVRAPLVELAAAGVPIPAPVLVIGPVILGAAILWWAQRRFATLSSKNRATSASAASLTVAQQASKSASSP